jgi:HPt (histidine-containing phosphotransfer) domain-containing protein
MTDQAINPATYRELQESAGEEFVNELVDTFLEEAPQMIGDLRAALAARDAESYRRQAHSLKSNCNTFGALTLAGLSRDVELGGLHDEAGRDQAAVDALATEFERVAAALRKLRNA